MNKPVSYQLAELLKKTGFNERCKEIYAYGKSDIAIGNIAGLDNKNRRGYFLAPRLGDLITWLWEEKKVWITVDRNLNYFYISSIKEYSEERNLNHVIEKEELEFENFITFEEAYGAAIEYYLISKSK